MYLNHVAFAERVARKYSNRNRHLVAALRVRGGNVVGFGVNRIRYNKDFSYFNCSLHAEADLVRKSEFDLDGDKICIYRFNLSQDRGDIRDSMPCPLCAHLLAQAGAGRLYFVLNGRVECRKPSDMRMVTSNPIAITNDYIPHYSTDPTHPLDLSAHT